ncbi:MAG: exodeoxyribonuclease VII large subunit, partial [Lachnospiraceae bacterium]
MPANKGRVFSVGQVNAYLRNLFSSDYLLRNLCVRGEVSNLKYHSSGHIYFTLKDASGTLSCIMFAGSVSRGLSFRMHEGDEVLVTGSITVWEKGGTYQLYAARIERAGAGELNERYEA